MFPVFVSPIEFDDVFREDGKDLNMQGIEAPEEPMDQVPTANDEGLAEQEDGSQVKAADQAKEGMPLQTFVFSATLSRDLQQNLKKRKRPKPDSRKRKGTST